MPSRLMHLRVDKFRHVKPGTAIDFGARFNTVVGQNGAGKTTLLELVSAIVRNDFRAFAGEDLALHFLVADDDQELEGDLHSTVTSNGGSTPKLTLCATLRVPSSQLNIVADPNKSAITFEGKTYSGHGLPPVSENIGLLHAARAILPNTPEFTQFKNIGDLSRDIIHDFKTDVTTRIDEGTETFTKLFSEYVDRDRPPPLGIESTVTKPYKPRTVGYHLPDDIVQHELTSDNDTHDSISFNPSVPMLAEFISLSQYTDARLILTKTAKTHAGTRTVYANPLARFTTRGGNEIPHHLLSFGEKRLLTFLIKLYAYPHTIIVDELANGMHHAWIERCIELMEDLGTQAFLSSQNPLLLDCLPLTRETYGTDHALVICEFSDTGEMVWRNLSEAETTDFFKSLDVGIQHVSEIMRSKGLW